MPAVPKTRPGSPAPLGATWDGEGTNFALYSEGATAVELVLVDREAREETRVPVRQRPSSCGTSTSRGSGPGSATATASTGRRTRSRACVSTRRRGSSIRTRRRSRASRTGSAALRLRHARTREGPRDERGRSARRAARASSSIRDSTGRTTRRRNVRCHDAVIYEAHVKGFTQLHPDVPEELRGTYAGARAPRR